MGGGGTDPEAVVGEHPRSASRLVLATFGLYRRYPLLFLTLAGGVVLPYCAIVLATTGDGPLSPSSGSSWATLVLGLAMPFLVTPLISALHINAVVEVREGRKPALSTVARAGLRVLPAVVAVSIMSGIGIGLGIVFFILPGIYLALRWVVVAQAAAIEREGWLPAMRSSGRLVSGHYGHVFVFAVFLVVITAAPGYLVELMLAESTSVVVSLLVGLPILIVTLSFAALATALLYFDLRVRQEATAPSIPDSQELPPAGHSSDPGDYSEENRPNGWYDDPSDPGRMRYWSGESTGWQGSRPAPRNRKTQEEGEAGE